MTQTRKGMGAVIGRLPENATQLFAVLMRGVGKREETCVHIAMYSYVQEETHQITRVLRVLEVAAW